jgi:hypothetical protein
MKKSTTKTAVPTYYSTFTHILNINGLIITPASPTTLKIFHYFQRTMQKRVFEFQMNQ